MIKKILMEPLVHFLVIAFLFFVAFEYFNQDTTDETVIVVAEGRIAQIKQSIESQRGREALPNELKTATQNYAINQMYLREARNLQLDVGDVVIDRRLRQKMEFLLEDLVASNEPSEEELLTYYKNHTSNYKKPAIYSFRQAHLSIDKEPSEIVQNIAKQQKRIDKGLDPESDVYMLPVKIVKQSASKIEELFGQGFANHLSNKPVNEWIGPFESTLGKHFIYLEKVTPEGTYSFAQIKTQVLKDWKNQNLKEAKQGYEEELLKTYSIAYESEENKEIGDE